MAKKNNLPKADKKATAEQWKKYCSRIKKAHRRFSSSLKKIDDGFVVNPDTTLKRMQLWVEQLDRIPDLSDEKSGIVVKSALPYIEPSNRTLSSKLIIQLLYKY